MSHKEQSMLSKDISLRPTYKKSLQSLMLLTVLVACNDDNDNEASPNPNPQTVEVEEEKSNEVVGEVNTTETGNPNTPDNLVINIENFYPEGITQDSSGNFYISSLGTASVAKVNQGNDNAEPFIAPGTIEGTAVGIHYSENSETLYVCGSDLTGTFPSAVYLFNLDGDLQGKLPLEGGGFCNDLTEDSDGNVYISDSFQGRVLKIEANTQNLSTWAQDASWLSSNPEVPLSLNGLSYNPDENSIYVGRIDLNELYHIKLNDDGTAGEVETFQIPGVIDGLKYNEEGSLYAVLNLSEFVELKFADGAWTSRVISNELEEPATFVIDENNNAWVTEARFTPLFDADPNTNSEAPFKVKRVGIE